MYATVVQCDMRAIDDALERGRMGRVLASQLGALPGFVVFVALDADTEAGRVAALCIFEDAFGIVAAQRVIDAWQQEYPAAVGTDIRRLGTGAVIVQKGL